MSVIKHVLGLGMRYVCLQVMHDAHVIMYERIVCDAILHDRDQLCPIDTLIPRDT